jgi:hypothetical protein
MQARSITLPLLVLCVFVAPHLKADTVLFTDSNGTASETIPAYYVGFCSNGSCSAGDGYPFLVATDTIPATVYIGDSRGLVSDEIVTTFPENSCTLGAGPLSPAQCAKYFTDANFVFTSGLDLSGSPSTCASVGGCLFTSNGLIQDVGAITWSPGFEVPTAGFTTTLEFQNVPEPSTFPLLVLSFALTSFLGTRRSKLPT